MTVETRPNLRGLPEDQREIALAHWYLWRVYQVTPGWNAPHPVLDALEAMMDNETKHRMAQARGSFWREVNKDSVHTIDNADLT